MQALPELAQSELRKALKSQGQPRWLTGTLWTVRSGDLTRSLDQTVDEEWCMVTWCTLTRRNAPLVIFPLATSVQGQGHLSAPTLDTQRPLKKEHLLGTCKQFVPHFTLSLNLEQQMLCNYQTDPRSQPTEEDGGCRPTTTAPPSSPAKPYPNQQN